MAHLTYEQATSKDYERKLLKKIFDKIALSNWFNSWKNTTGEFKLFTTGIHGNVGKKDFYEVMCWKYEDQLKTKESIYKGGYKEGGKFRFKSDNERKNFFDSYHNKFMKYLTSLWKTDTAVMLAYIPFTGDYSNVWSDEDWMDWFELTEDEREFVKLEIFRLKL